ncbi:LPD38 domain-containing protein [Bacteroides sp.]|uniref:LPD38 domain-containing protein n=1 Tax=Bacteroides sp. TaxID=29523 RepID=UPI00258521B8|nr:LPD38 domain-containing protein [Bacteroides sp.]
MPIFENKGVKYDVSPEYIPDFASEYPDAVTVIERPDKPYRVKASQYDIFMQQHPEPDISVDEMRDTDNFFGDFGERLAAGAGRLVGSSTNLLKKITTPVESAVDWANEHTKGAAGAAAQSLAGTIPGLGMIAHIPDKNAGLERLSKNAEAFAEDMHERSDRYKGKSFSYLWSEGDYQGAFGSAFLDAAESAATSTAIAATGGAGLVAAGLTTASDKYDELSRENPEMGETLKWANAIGTGAAESLSEVFGAGMMGRTVRNILQKSGREAAANLVKKNFLDKIASFEGKHWFAMPIASEGLEEAGNALASYAIDRLTGVERNDNIFKTMLDAGVAGSMGGAQFSPFIGAAKGYSAYQKRQITNRYKESSTFAGEILHEDVEKFNDAIVNRLKNPKSIQSFIDNVASVKNLNPEEKRKLEQYTVDLLNYNGYVDYVQSRIDEETRRRMDDIGRTANKDMGQVVTVKFPSSDQPVYITGGNIVFDEEGLVDAKQSDDILYYLDENGKVQQGRPEMFDSLIEQYPVEQLYADIINTVPGEVIAQEEKESEAADMQPVMFNPGDLVNLVDGRQGIVQQMSDDGGVIVEVDGMTEEIGVDSIIDNMSKNQTPNEDSSTDGDSRVLENVPEKTLESVVASLPKRNDGTIDYKAMTPQQQYEYTSLSESPQTALEDLRADIENKRSEISKSESRIEKASGGERASLRDEIRVKKQELADLEAFYQTVTPDVDSSAEENVILPASQTEIPINQESNTPESSIPMDEAGNPIYHQAEISDTLDALLDGSLTLEEVDQFVNNHISDAERRLTESGKKAPMMELDIDGYKARKKEWEEGRKPIEQEKSYWEDIKSKLQDARVKPGEEAAINLMRNTAPQSGEELAAQMLANGSIKLLQDDYRRETGGRISESRSLFGLFAGKDKGGVSIERAGEILMQADLENGTNFFDQKDPNAGRNAIIEVLSTARTRGDLINYIKNRREAKAEEMRQAEYNEYARWCEENYHLSPEDYEAYEDAVVRDFKEKMLTDEEQFELDSQMADEIRAIQEELEEIDAILAQNRTEKDENTEGNDESGGDVLREGGSEILQGEQSAQTGRSGEIEAGEPAGPGVDRANGVAQESAPGEIKPIGKGVFGDIYDQFRGKAKEAIKFLLRKRSGEAIGALHHKEVGDIDLVWGKEGTGKSNGFGLSKLAKFHPEVLDSLQDILDDMVVISRSANRVNLESKTHKAAVRLEWDGEKKNWLLTAFEKEKPTATDRTTDIGDTELQNDTAPLQTESSSTDKDSDSSRNINDLSEKIADAEANTDINPTEAQKEAGNYKKGHVRVGTFDISIEQPKGSVRSGVDANGKKWETTMQNTYGYIRGTEGVDGDHIDVFLSDDIDGWNGRKAFVVDQYNEDGSFDEHKVMLGFNEAADAETAYFANYDKDWAKKHKTVVTPVNLEDFEKWIGSSHRKTKAFAEYKSVKTEDVPQKVESSVSGNGYTIEPAQYTTKRGKVLDMHLVKFQSELRKEVQKHTAMFAKEMKGWWDREKRGFMMRSEEDARRLVDYATDAQSQPPLSLSDLSKVNDGDVQFAESPQAKIQKQEEKQEYTPVWQYSVSVDKETGYTTLKRDDVSGSIPIGDGRFNYTANSPEEMLEIVRNPKNFDQELRDAVETILENKVKIREIARAEKAETVKQEPKSENNPSGNRLVTDERYAELRERMRKKLLGQMNIGIDPEILAIGTEMAVYHLEKGSRKFAEYATAMIADLGDAIRPYLKAFYNGARDLPEVLENGLNKEMSSYDEVQAFDVTNFDKPGIDIFATAETIAREAEVNKEVEIAEERIKKTRSTRKKVEKKTVISRKSNSLDLFDNQFDNNETNNKDGLRRNDAVRPEGLSTNGNRHGQGLSRGTETSGENEQQAGRGTDNEREGTGDAVDRAVRPRLSDSLNEQSIEGKRKKEIENNRKLADELKGVTLRLNDKLGGEHEVSGIVYYELANVFHCNDNISGPFQVTRKELDAILKVARKNEDKNTFAPKNTRNNHSERGKDHAPTSVDARIEANIKAIELANLLLESGEQATEKQMQTLRKFSGWGGLGKAFNEDTSYAPNPIAKKLRELLGEKAYKEAVMSANSAYYTPAYVVDTLWDIAEQMGFNGGNILEGSAGIGNILGQMPTNISERSDIHAIEIDGTSGGILSLLYPDAKVEIQGFEQTRIPNGSVDLAITNVPFVTGLRVNDITGDKDLSKKFHNIHDFCIAKNVRKLREGGLGIFITSNGTLDNSKKLRDWIVSEGGSDFVGAFRMHNKTFGGTGVTSDIVVIRKRVNGQKSVHAIDVSDVSGERMTEYDTGETRKVKGKETPVIKQLSMDYNRYFIEHPENMAGEMHFAFEKGDTFRPTSKGLYPKQDKKQEDMLSEFVRSFSAEEFGERSTELVTDAMPGKKIGEVFVKDGKLYINSTASAQPLDVNANKVKGHTKVECFEAYTAIKDALAEVLSYQTENESDEGLKPLLDKLNKAYDDFVSTYGHFNKNTAIAFLRNDVDYANVFALEKFEETADEKGNRVQKFDKTDIFSKRVVEKEKEPTPTNIKDGIIASIFKFGRVDVPYIAEQLGTGIEDVKNEIIESGYGFENPVTRQMEASYQYLSGNIREKLRQAKENNENGKFDRNIRALQEVMPMEIPAHLIDFTLGSSWIDPKLYEDFVKERTEVDVRFTAVGGTWFMKEPYFTNYEKNRAMGVTSEMLGRTIMGHTLIEAAIQNKSITVSTTKKHYNGTTETITDKEATQACAAKIDEIRQDFKDWARQKMQSDPKMSALIERIYNDTFNNFVPMSVPDEFVPEYFGGASHEFKMRPHQGRAIVRGTQQPLLLAHEVGTGKTFTLISTAMEMRRLGTARKPMIVVQNATVGQFVASAKELYPNAKILTLEEADRNAEGRKNFYAKIRYNDWDMIVVPQSTFEFIPDSEEREMAFVQDKIEEKMLILEKMKEEDPDGKSMITRQAEREIELLEEQLVELTNNASKKRTANDEKKRAIALQNAEVKAMEMLDRRTDDVENFDDMNIDALLVDEAHEYKHLGFATAMQRGVKGVDPSYSKKSQGVFLKTQAILEKNNGRNVIFATGTPISNTAAEIWTFMRYLMPADTMKEYGIYYFDDFVRNFGNIQQMLEFTTSGKFKENNRFAGYVNLPELVRIWSGVSDTVLTKEAGGVKDKIPEMEGGKAQDLYLPQTRALRSIMKFVKNELEQYEQMSGKEKKENSHIPLTMYGIAKAAAVDARLVLSDTEDDPNSKTNEAVRQTLRSLKETADYKGTVAIFADNYQNKQSGFNLYDDIRDKLIAEGVPADEIVVMRSGMTVKKKLEIFEKVNRGEVRVILGSTFTLGTGVNIQERLHTLIHLDAPNRPMDYTQRNGRILRQGNLHKDMGKPVRILRFGVEDSLDVTAYQRLKTKGAIADSIMNGKQVMTNSMSNRVLEEEEDVFGDTIAQLSGSEYAMLKNNAEKNVRKYESRKKQWEADQTYIHNAKPRLKGLIKDADARIEKHSKLLADIRSSFPDGKFKEIVIGKNHFTAVEGMDDFFKEYNKSILADAKKIKDGDIAGDQTRELTVQISNFTFKVKTFLQKEMNRDGGALFVEVHRKMYYSCPELDLEAVPVKQSLLRNAIEDIVKNVITGKDDANRLEVAKNSKKHNEAELEQLLSREGKPFEYKDELVQAKKQFEEYAELMKKELQEKEAKYAEMDKTVETATDIVNIGEEDEAQSHINRKDDKNVRFRSASDSLMETSSKFSQVAAIDELASSLHIPIHIIRDINDITDEDKDTQRKKRGSKGWYDMETGEVYLVLPNAENIADAQATALHEVVAHKGLRGLLGEKFDDMMDSVYRNLPEDVRRKVTRAGLSRYGGDFRIATEEYLASVAENGVFEPSIWQKIKSAIRGFFRSLGIDLRMRDEDIAYMLWKSKNRLEKGDSLVTIIHKVAKDGNMRDTLLFRDPLVRGGTILSTPSEDRRTMIRTIGAVSEGVRSFSAMTREFYKRFREGYQDQKIHILDFQKAVEKETGHKVKDYEDAYIYENTTQGRAEYDVNHFKANEFAALVNEVARLSRDGKNIDKDKRRKVDLYMKAKHGLERNEVMRREALASVEQPSPELIESIGNKDFAGLTAITKALSAETKGMDEDIVRRFVEEFEKENDTKKLWEAVGKATRATLEKMYQCNLISRESRDRISGKYEYYVPLKEWEETTAGDIWDYIDSNRDIVSNPIKKAKGRTSMAGDILANIASDYESATMMGYKNLVKLRFANLVRNSKTGMASVSRQWYVKSGVDAEGRTLWEPVSATGLTEDAETNVSIINDFEEKMKELQEKGEAKTQREVLNLGVPIKDWQEQQHVVRVKEGGRDLLVYINGNPVVSQAVNGINRASLDNVVLKGLNNVRKFMMQNYTSRNINFILRNFARDFFYANTMNFVKYGAAYEGRFLKNYPLALWRIAKVEIGGRTDLEYEAFLRGGGKTGYVATFGYDKYKKEVERLLNRNAGGRVRVKDVFNVLGGYFEMVNGVVENGGRFTTYLTAKESGMTELQSINAAKEVSVNFNRRGSGAMGAVYMQNFFHFFNAAIQGTHNFAHAAKHNPVRAGAAIAMWATLGFAVSTLSKMLFGDDDEYNDIPDYVRQNNLILPMGAPGKYVLLPLPVELRMLFGLGDMSAQYTRGEYKGRDFTSDVMGKLMDVLPLSIESNATDNLVEAATRTFTPDMISPITEAYLFNENYFGKRITGRNEFNKYVPEYHKVTTGTSKAIIKASERLNSLSGGDYASKGKLDYALLNPSAVEYLFEQYLGGVGKAIAQCYKTVEGAVTGDVQLRNIPVVSGLTYDTENMVPRNYTNERYNHYVKEYEEMQSRDRMYRKGLEGGKDLSGNYKSFANSRAYRRYQTTGFYKKAIESMYDMARLMDGEEKKALYEQARKTKEMMINELDKIGDE